MGGTEETTSGRMRLEPLRDRLRRPILVINDSPIKQFAENEHAVGQSALESYLRMTNRVTNGEQVTVFGYGACGRGVAANFRAARARVSVVDVDPVTRLRAHLDGFGTPPRDAAIASADLIITVTGARDVLTAADLPLLRDGVILANSGHFPTEIDAPGLTGAAEVASTTEYPDDLLTLELTDGRRIHLLARGHMFNLAGPRPLGQLHRVDGPGLRAAGPLPGGGRPPERRRHQLRRPGPPRYRRGGRPRVPGPEVPGGFVTPAGLARG